MQTLLQLNSEQLIPRSSFEMIQVWFDGGTGPPPYGSYEILGGQIVHHKISRQQFPFPLTCNEAEYFIFLEALCCLEQNQLFPDKIDCRLEIFTDSMLLRNQVMGTWKCRKPHLEKLRNEALQHLANYGDWEIVWEGRNNNVRRFGH